MLLPPNLIVTGHPIGHMIPRLHILPLASWIESANHETRTHLNLPSMLMKIIAGGSNKFNGSWRRPDPTKRKAQGLILTGHAGGETANSENANENVNGAPTVAPELPVWLLQMFVSTRWLVLSSTLDDLSMTNVRH
jgi:hypothetical protein